MHNQRFCSTPCRDLKLGARKRARRGSTSEAGYGAAHRRLRKQWAAVVAEGRATCTRCRKRIPPAAAWHLDHTDDRTGYLGPACAHCNTSAGASKGNRERAGATAPTSSTPRVITW